MVFYLLSDDKTFYQQNHIKKRLRHLVQHWRKLSSSWRTNIARNQRGDVYVYTHTNIFLLQRGNRRTEDKKWIWNSIFKEKRFHRKVKTAWSKTILITSNHFWSFRVGVEAGRPQKLGDTIPAFLSLSTCDVGHVGIH